MSKDEQNNEPRRKFGYLVDSVVLELIQPVVQTRGGQEQKFSSVEVRPPKAHEVRAAFKKEGDQRQDFLVGKLVSLIGDEAYTFTPERIDNLTYADAHRLREAATDFLFPEAVDKKA